MNEIRLVRVPYYAHDFSSVPERWVEVPDFLAVGWTGDPPKDGGYLIPKAFDPFRYFAPVSPWRRMLHSERTAYRRMPLFWRPIHHLIRLLTAWGPLWPIWRAYRQRWPHG